MRTIVSFAALFLSVSLVQLGSGVLGPLDAIAGAARGFAAGEIGVLGSAHFFGFFIGCWLTPRLMGSVGHSRAFAAVASIGAIAALLHPVFPTPEAWAILRVGSGLAVAGAYTIVESWLQAKVENANRGRVLGVYRVVDMSASVAAQGLVAVLDPTSYVAYNVIAALSCLCLIPLALTTSTPPPATSAPRLRPLAALRLSPLGVVSVMVVGLTSSSFRMVGPVYALNNGLAAREVALFMASGVLGGAVAQLPAAWASDKFDRRLALIGMSAAACAVCGAISSGALGGGAATYLAAFAFGAAAFPLYSIAASHANDFARPEEMVELNAALMFYFGLGAIVSPLAAGRLMESYGPGALFLYIASAHVGLILFSLFRMTRRPVQPEKTPHRYLPRTSFVLTRLFKAKR